MQRGRLRDRFAEAERDPFGLVVEHDRDGVESAPVGGDQMRVVDHEVERVAADLGDRSIDPQFGGAGAGERGGGEVGLETQLVPHGPDASGEEIGVHDLGVVEGRRVVGKFTCGHRASVGSCA